jgi:ATP-dependent DNA ligase
LCRCGANAAALFASDLIEHDGGDLRDLPLIDRKRRLAELIAVTRDGQTAFPKNWSLAQYASRSQRERARETPS